MESYQQDIKQRSREKLISHAVLSLTTERASSFLVSKEHLVRITDAFNERLRQVLPEETTKNFKVYLKSFEKYKKQWLASYKNISKPKSANELKVLYLAGPEPLNDIQVLQQNGISLNNIWAVEMDKANYTEALSSLRNAKIDVKIHRGNLTDFFEYTNHEFDIIYFDACSPLISPANSPLETLRQIFDNKRLTSLSALITNFAEPGNNFDWGKIMSCWFATKLDIQVPSNPYEDSSDPMAKTGSLAEYSKVINENLPDYYGRFLRYFTACFAGEMVPIWQACSLGSIQTDYLLNEQVLFKELDKIRKNPISGTSVEEILSSIQHYRLAVDSYPLLNFARMVKEELPDNHPLHRLMSSKRRNISLEDAMYVGSLLKGIEEAATQFKTFIFDICSDRLKQILGNLDFFDRYMHIACDIPMKNLIVELLFGLYGNPYLAHAGKQLSLEYKAKSTVMYSDVYIFDQCRYLYDYLPTPDLFESFFQNFESQVIVRGCIDGILRNHYEINQCFMQWGFIEGRFGEFDYEELPDRINLNENVV